MYKSVISIEYDINWC